MHRRSALLLRLNDFEIPIAFRAEHFCLDVSDDGLPWWLLWQAIKEFANVVVVALDFQRHPVWAVADETAQPELCGIAIHGRPKANALDTTNYLRAYAGFHSPTTPS